ncbi:MAG: hypothetical protein ONB06_12140 [candidate division KSB1 bacterium]|nr:hypothetical protein [candidate division KSB1 bacterium]
MDIARPPYQVTKKVSREDWQYEALQMLAAREQRSIAAGISSTTMRRLDNVLQ